MVMWRCVAPFTGQPDAGYLKTPGDIRRSADSSRENVHMVMTVEMIGPHAGSDHLFDLCTKLPFDLLRIKTSRKRKRGLTR